LPAAIIVVIGMIIMHDLLDLYSDHHLITIKPSQPAFKMLSRSLFTTASSSSRSLLFERFALSTVNFKLNI
jgi:hypothetical protein